MLVSAFILGLLGSFHCIGMCGPIAFMLPIDRQHKFKGISQTLIYHLGRIFSYATIGAIFGLLGKGFYFFGMQQQLSIAVGLLMISVVLLPDFFRKYSITKPLFRFTSKVKSSLGASMKRKDNPTFFTIGFLNGLLPCGLVYMAVFGALASSNILNGIIYMSLFGLGTIPLMTAVVFLGNYTQKINKQKIQKVIPFIVIVIGVVFVLRGLGLGIPYVSPEPVMTHLVDASQSCH